MLIFQGVKCSLQNLHITFSNATKPLPQLLTDFDSNSPYDQLNSKTFQAKKKTYNKTPSPTFKKKTPQKSQVNIYYWLVVSTYLKNMSQNGNLSQTGVKIKNIWNHQPVY